MDQDFLSASSCTVFTFKGSSGFLRFSALTASADNISGLLSLWLPLHPRNIAISVCGGNNFMQFHYTVQDDPVMMMIELLLLSEAQSRLFFSLQQNTRENSAWYHPVRNPRDINFSTTHLHPEFPKVKGYKLQFPLALLHTAQICCPNITPVGVGPSRPTQNRFLYKEILKKTKKIYVKDVVFSPEAKWLRQQASWAYSPLSLGHVRLLETLCQLPHPAEDAMPSHL